MIPPPQNLPSLEDILGITNGYLDHGDPPPEMRKMMGVGSVPIRPRVARAAGIIEDHLGPEIGQVIENLRALGRYTVQSRTCAVIGVSGPGSAAMEMAIANLASWGHKLLACVTGTFSNRMADMAKRIGAHVVEYRVAPGEPCRASKVRELLENNGEFRALTIVHGETSTGVENFELVEILRAAREAGLLTIVDTVCTLGAMRFHMDAWGADAVFTAGQKSLGSFPGMSMAFFSEKAMRAIASRERAPAQWTLDAKLAQVFWGPTHGYHYTAAVNAMFAMHEALMDMTTEGLEKRWKRHTDSSLALQAAVEAMGLTLYADNRWRLPTAVAIRDPECGGHDELLARMKTRHRIVIAGSFGLPIFRIGQMGLQATKEYRDPTVSALKETLERLND